MTSISPITFVANNSSDAQLGELEAELEKALSRNEGVDKNHSVFETHI